MKNLNSFEKIDRAEFGREMISCLDSGVVSERMGSMIFSLVYTHVNSKFFRVLNDDIKDDAASSAIELVLKRIIGKSRPSDDSKMFDYYRSIVINFLRKFLTRNVYGTERNVDLFGCVTATNFVNENGKSMNAIVIPTSRLSGKLLYKYTNTHYEEDFETLD